MSQPEDEETKEHPAYPQPVDAQPVEAQPPDQPVVPITPIGAPAPAFTPPATPPGTAAAPSADPVPAGASPVTPPAGQTWQQPTALGFQQPAAPQWQQPHSSSLSTAGSASMAAAAGPTAGSAAMAAATARLATAGWAAVATAGRAAVATTGTPGMAAAGWLSRPARVGRPAPMAGGTALLDLSAGGCGRVAARALRPDRRRRWSVAAWPGIGAEKVHPALNDQFLWTADRPRDDARPDQPHACHPACLRGDRGAGGRRDIRPQGMGAGDRNPGVVARPCCRDRQRQLFSRAFARPSVPMVASIAVVLGYAFVLVSLLAGGRHFRDRYSGRAGSAGSRCHRVHGKTMSKREADRPI